MQIHFETVVAQYVVLSRIRLASPRMRCIRVRLALLVGRPGRSEFKHVPSCGATYQLLYCFPPLELQTHNC